MRNDPYLLDKIISVRVPTVANVLSARASEITTLRDAGAVRRKIANIILDSLQDAKRLLRRGETAAACEELQSLIAYFNKQINAGKLAPVYGEPVVSSAYRLRKTLSCG